MKYTEKEAIILTEVKEKVASHDQDLKDQKNITLFFTIIVGVTLVSTLVGLGGLYITAFNTKNDYVNSQEEHLYNLNNEINQLKTNLELLKAKNSYLK